MGKTHIENKLQQCGEVFDPVLENCFTNGSGAAAPPIIDGVCWRVLTENLRS